MKKILVTGAAGFIGFHLSTKLIQRGDQVVGIDNLNDYYDVNIKKARLAQLANKKGFTFVRMSLENREGMDGLFKSGDFDVVVNLAAQAGVRYSLKNPYAYVDSNIMGFLNILEGCRHSHVNYLAFASSSSVYGANTSMPFSVRQSGDHPMSLYTATKKANELMAHTYASLYNIPCTGLRFFTVYGPWGRPDMAFFLFTKALLKGEAIDVFNYGKMRRDFTYIDDIIEGVSRIIDRIPLPNPAWNGNDPDPASSYAPYRLYNIEALEEWLGRKAEKNFLPMQAGDVPATYADVDNLVSDIGVKPSTTIEAGITEFVKWYRNYFEENE